MSCWLLRVCMRVPSDSPVCENNAFFDDSIWKCLEKLSFESTTSNKGNKLETSMCHAYRIRAVNKKRKPKYCTKNWFSSAEMSSERQSTHSSREKRVKSQKYRRALSLTTLLCVRLLVCKWRHRNAVTFRFGCCLMRRKSVCRPIICFSQAKITNPNYRRINQNMRKLRAEREANERKREKRKTLFFFVCFLFEPDENDFEAKVKTKMHTRHRHHRIAPNHRRT